MTEKQLSSILLKKSKTSSFPVVSGGRGGARKRKEIVSGGASSMSNTISLGDIDDKTPEIFRRKVSQRLAYFPEDPIVITIDSHGGDVYSAFAILDFMDHIRKDCGCSIVTVCTGKAMSAGALILSAGDVRAATPNSVIMIHETLAAIPFSSFRDVVVETEEIQRVNDQMLKIMAKNMKCTVPALKALFGKKRDVYLTPTQALDINIIDKIGFPEIKITTSMEIS
jgi:ATP-dependent Clp endopeptidase proteolytic subunit ClpP